MCPFPPQHPSLEATVSTDSGPGGRDNREDWNCVINGGQRGAVDYQYTVHPVIMSIQIKHYLFELKNKQ